MNLERRLILEAHIEFVRLKKSTDSAAWTMWEERHGKVWSKEKGIGGKKAFDSIKPCDTEVTSKFRGEWKTNEVLSKFLGVKSPPKRAQIFTRGAMVETLSLNIAGASQSDLEWISYEKMFPQNRANMLSWRWSASDSMWTFSFDDPERVTLHMNANSLESEWRHSTNEITLQGISRVHCGGTKFLISMRTHQTTLIIMVGMKIIRMARSLVKYYNRERMNKRLVSLNSCGWCQERAGRYKNKCTCNYRDFLCATTLLDAERPFTVTKYAQRTKYY